MELIFSPTSISFFSKGLSALLLFFELSTSSVRCWIGVVDQINPPWLVISKEPNEQISIHLEEGYMSIREGDWVIYWTHQKRLERLDSSGSRMENKHQQHLIDMLIQPY